MISSRIVLLLSGLALAAFVGCERHEFESTKRLHGGHGGHHDEAHGDHHGDDHGDSAKHGEEPAAETKDKDKDSAETPAAGEPRKTGI